jgi:hypothetical protein
MPTTGRPQQRHDHRLQHLVHRTGDVTIATDLGVLRSTARGWLGGAPTAVVCLDVADLTEPELRQEILKLRRRVQKLTALLRLVLAVLRNSGFRLWISNSRLAFSVGRTESCMPNGTNSARAVEKLRSGGNRRVKLRSPAKSWK